MVVHWLALSQHMHSGFDTAGQLWPFCLEFAYLIGFPLGTPLSSHSPKTCTLDSKLPIGVNVSVNFCLPLIDKRV